MKIVQEMRPIPGLEERVELETQAALELVGGASENCFPKIEALLMTDPEFSAALAFVSKSKKTDCYESWTDFLVCAMFCRGLHEKCLKFYRSKGPQLVDILPEAQRHEYEQKMVYALGLARELHRQQRQGPWSWFMGQVNRGIRFNCSGILEIGTTTKTLLEALKIAREQSNERLEEETVEQLLKIKQSLRTLRDDAYTKVEMDIADEASVLIAAISKALNTCS